MKNMKILTALMGATLMLSVSSATLANQVPRALSTDSRLRVVPYSQNNVVTLYCQLMIMTSIQLGKDEVIQGVKVGESIAWEATTNKAHPNMLFIKPTMEGGDTNMTLLTNLHVYNFRLLALNPKSNVYSKIAPTYNLRFSYPEDEALAAAEKAANLETERNAVVANNEASPLDWNWGYSFSCHCQTDLVPIRAFDDGKFTYFQFAPHSQIPAIFIVDGQGHESLANWNMKGEYVVIQKTARQFSMRSGDVVSCVFNDKYKS